MAKKKHAFPEKVSELKVPSDYSPTCQGCTNTMLGCYLTCEQKFMFRLNRLRPEGPTKGALLFGGLVHHVLARVLVDATKVTNLMHALNGWMEEYRKKEEKNYKIDRQEFENYCGFVEALIPGYLRVYKRELTARTFTYIEQHMEAMGSYFKWRGKVDALYTPVKTLWLLEHKTMGRVDEEGILFALMMDSQLRIYDMLVEANVTALDGCLFDVIRTPQLRRKQNEPLVDFTARVRDDVQARPEHYFKQWEVKIGKRERAQFMAKLGQIEDRMMRLVSGEDKPLQNTYVCRTPARQCEYLANCATDSTRGLVQQKYVHPELEV